MFSWAVMAALTRLICLRRQDERERDSASKDATQRVRRRNEGEKKESARRDGQGRDPSFLAKLKVTSPRWAMK